MLIQGLNFLLFCYPTILWGLIGFSAESLISSHQRGKENDPVGGYLWAKPMIGLSLPSVLSWSEFRVTSSPTYRGDWEMLLSCILRREGKQKN